MRHPINQLRTLCRATKWWVAEARRDDRGEITSSLLFTGGMVLLAVAIVGIITAGATGFAEGIDFGL